MTYSSKYDKFYYLTYDISGAKEDDFVNTIKNDWITLN